MDYANGKIYRLVCNKTGLQYIGSTTQPLHKRKNTHKGHYVNWLQNKRGYVSSFLIIEVGDYDIVLIEKYPCKSREELNSRERYYIEKLDCVNKSKPAHTLTKEERQAYLQEYRAKHQDDIKKKNKEYYQQYTQEHNERSKQYYESNKERILARRKEYYLKQKAKQNLPG